MYALQLLLLALAPSAAACGALGQVPRLFDRMPSVSIAVADESFEVRLAATDETRAQGFQNVPPALMEEEAIYFVLSRASEPSFHMRNVAAPLMIAWIGHDERVIAVDRMAPGTAGHGPGRPVSAALEYTEHHPLAEHVRPGVRVRLGSERAAEN